MFPGPIWVTNELISIEGKSNSKSNWKDIIIKKKKIILDDYGCTLMAPGPVGMVCLVWGSHL